MVRKSASSASPNTALCYIRKSWTRDEKDAVSPDRQRAHIQRVCDDHGWIPEWYEDTDGHRSGMHEKNRPGWLALKARLDDSDVVALVANDLARLHRKGWRVGDLLDYVDQRGITLVLADPRRHIDFSSPHGRIMAQLSAIFDEWYATDISERWKASIAHRKSKGVTVGLPPFGTKRDKKTGYLSRSTEGAWYMPDGTWLPGIEGQQPPTEGALWRGYYDCAEQILRLYAEQWAGRDKITRQLQKDGWAFRDRDGNPRPLETDDVRRVTNNWPEYGGIVLGSRARERHPYEYDPKSINLNPGRAVFDVKLLQKVGQVQKERTRIAPDRGHSKSDFDYPLSGITYCAHCEQQAVEQKNPKLRSRLGGKSQSRYRHKAGASCGCKKKSVAREKYEADFLRLIQLLTVKPEMLDKMKDLALQAKVIHQDDEDAEAKRDSAIAKCRRKIEAARNLYEDGDMSREEYLRRKDQNEREIAQWEAYTTETENLSIELAMCIDAVGKISQIWETSSEEDKQGMARNLFDHVIFDLEKQRIVDFQLKAWADKFLILRRALYPNGSDSDNNDTGNGHAASTIDGTKGVSSPVRVTPLPTP